MNTFSTSPFHATFAVGMLGFPYHDRPYPHPPLAPLDPQLTPRRPYARPSNQAPAGNSLVSPDKPTRHPPTRFSRPDGHRSRRTHGSEKHAEKIRPLRRFSPLTPLPFSPRPFRTQPPTCLLRSHPRLSADLKLTLWWRVVHAYVCVTETSN